MGEKIFKAYRSGIAKMEEKCVCMWICLGLGGMGGGGKRSFQFNQINKIYLFI